MCDPEVAVTRSSLGFLSFFVELLWVSRLQRWVLGWFSGVMGLWCVWFELEDLQWWLAFICREERRWWWWSEKVWKIALSPFFIGCGQFERHRKLRDLIAKMELGELDPRTSIWSGPRVDYGQLRFNASLGRVEPVQTDSGWFEPGSSQFKSNFEF